MNKNLQKPIGILGGTYDPIHFGHLRTALEIKQALDLSQVYLTPCYQPVHRPQPIASSEQRLAMVQCAIESEPTLKVDTCEIERQGPSYTIDTLTTLRSQLPETPICLIIGIDALIGFPSWHRYQEIVQIAHLIIVHRPQYQLPHVGVIAELLQQHLKNTVNALHESLSGTFFLQRVTSLDISATDIRQQISIGKNPRFLLPDSVYTYIQDHQLYQNK